jgi:hypothetical protein
MIVECGNCHAAQMQVTRIFGRDFEGYCPRCGLIFGVFVPLQMPVETANNNTV